MSKDLQLELAKEPGVIMEKADIRRAGGRDVTGDSGGEKRLAIDESEVVELARFQVLVCDPRLHEGARDLHHLVLRYGQQRTQATARPVY